MFYHQNTRTYKKWEILQLMKQMLSEGIQKVHFTI